VLKTSKAYQAKLNCGISVSKWFLAAGRNCVESI